MGGEIQIARSVPGPGVVINQRRRKCQHASVGRNAGQGHHLPLTGPHVQGVRIFPRVRDDELVPDLPSGHRLR